MPAGSLDAADAGYATHDTLASHALLIGLQDDRLLDVFRDTLVRPLEEHDAVAARSWCEPWSCSSAPEAAISTRPMSCTCTSTACGSG